jgi:hypothetical protein
MPPVPIGTCRQENCKVVTDGKCLEGFEDLEQCPHFFSTQQRTSEGVPPEVAAPEQAGPSETMDLPDGADLSPDSAIVITRAFMTRLVILAGAPDSGKTTLLTSIYESFQWGPFAGYIFAGSRTLPGLERRCHLARIVSGRTIADTERTKPGQRHQLLHLRVRAQDLSKPAQDLLLSDLSGETFRLAKDSTEECKSLSILRRTDHFVLLLDGDKLARVESRAEAATDGAALLRSCLDAEMLGRHSLVDVLFTKWDLVQSCADKSGTKAYIAHIEEEMRRRFESRVGRLRFFQVAARPAEGSELPFAYGLSEVLPSWVEETYASLGLRHQAFREPRWTGEFDRYLLTRLSHMFTTE